MRPSLVKRAKEREVQEGKSPGIYIVVGNAKLGDQYPSYIVRQRGGEWTCDCLSPSRTGGQFKSTCSHITGVLLHIEEHGEWTGPDGGDDRSPAQRALEQHFLEGEPTTVEEEPARKASPAPPVFEDTHHPVKLEVTLPEPTNGFPDSSREGLDQKNPGEIPPTFDALDPEMFWGLVDQDPDWIPHPGQIKLHDSEPDLPSKFQEFREPQWQAIREIDAALDEGYKVVFVSAPTGSGKTLLAETVRRIRGIRGIYTCTTKTLQDQILREFEYAKVIKGRANYPTLDNPNVTAADCNKRKTSLPACKDCPGWSAGSAWGTDNPDMTDPTMGSFSWHCTNCHPWDECPYERAKMEAATARLAVLNTAYFLAETNYINNSLFRGRGLALIDEADMLESELMRFIEVTITARDRKILGVGLPEKKTVDESWVEWLIEEVLPACRDKLKEVNPAPDLFGDFNVDDLRLKKKLVQLLRKVKSLTKEVEDEETGEMKYVLNENWIYTGYEKNMRGEYPPDDKVSVTFKPVHVEDWAHPILWSKAGQFVLLSATFVAPAMEAEFLGLEDDEWTVVEVPSSFPVLQRPIIPRMVANVINKEMQEATPLLIAEIEKILDEHPGERVLIHSVSYQLTKDLYYELRRTNHGQRLQTYFNAQDRQDALDRYLAMSNGVLIAPSFDRGVDLPADDCRVIVVAKIPYLSMGDKQVSARLYGQGKTGRMWYAIQAIRTLCQMTGRGMRSAEDSCRTYILDRQFSRLYNENRRLFPKWWAEAIVWDVNDPKWRGMA